MAHPKRKISTTRRDKRRTHHNLKLINFVLCPITGKSHLPHRAFWHEDKLYYRGKIVIDNSISTVETTAKS